MQYNQAKQDLINAENDLKIIKEGSIGGSSSANTDIRATVPGTVLEIPVEEGDQVLNLIVLIQVQLLLQLQI